MTTKEDNIGKYNEKKIAGFSREYAASCPTLVTTIDRQIPSSRNIHGLCPFTLQTTLLRSNWPQGSKWPRDVMFEADEQMKVWGAHKRNAEL